eukprot:1129120_1
MIDGCLISSINIRLCIVFTVFYHLLFIGCMDFSYTYSYNPLGADFYGLQTVPIFELPKPQLGKGHTLSGHSTWSSFSDYVHRSGKCLNIDGAITSSMFEIFKKK